MNNLRNLDGWQQLPTDKKLFFLYGHPLATFEIAEKLPTMNDIIAAATATNKSAFQNTKGNKTAQHLAKLQSTDVYNALKKKTTNKLRAIFASQFSKSGQTEMIKGNVCVVVVWVYDTKASDADGLDAGRKFIHDALQGSEIIKNDNLTVISELHSLFEKRTDGSTTKIYLFRPLF